MQISKETILEKTHYGLNIYALVLRQYYPGATVLFLSGRDCKPAQNPFNADKSTLMVQIVNNIAVHYCTENSISKGDAFDFAALHYNLCGDELYKKLNDELHLRIDKATSFYNPVVKEIEAIPEQSFKRIIPMFSFYKAPVSNIIPYGKINLLEAYNLITGSNYASCTSTLRQIENKQDARKYKANHFDYVTFSGTFSTRNDKSLLKHSNLLTVDFDHINNVSELKQQLLNDDYFETELMFVSPSGDGLKWIIPIDLTKAKQADYFKAIANYVKKTYQLEIDHSGKDISRACFLPQDINAFINPKYLL
jgi:hypothetical protein